MTYRGIVIGVAAAVSAACEQGPGSKPPIVLYEVASTTTPEALVPDKPASLVVLVTSKADGLPVEGALIAITAGIATGGTGGTRGLALGTPTETEPGTYELTGLTLAEGTWALAVEISALAGKETKALELVVSCASQGGVGAHCCESAACGEGLVCGFGSCAAEPTAPGLACYDSPECASFICTEGACAAPACDDQVHNGTETDDDCGGGTCRACALGKGCLSAADCASNRCEAGACQPTLPVLGGGTHAIDAVELTLIGTNKDKLSTPRDLAFNPYIAGELWVVNQTNESVTVYFNVGSALQSSQYFHGGGGDHFLAQPAGIAFGAEGFAATVQETDELTQGRMTPEDFMGPSLWNTDLQVFNAGWASHMDMLHNSPNAVGIAWERNNIYWVFDGYHQSLTRYDFKADHGEGGEDHSDGTIYRYAEGQVAYVPGVHSGLFMDYAASRLYVADTGNHRIAVLDTSSGTPGAAIDPNYDSCIMRKVKGATLTTLVDGPAVGLVSPSGIALWDDLLFVADHETSTIHAFDPSGTRVDWLETGLPAKSLQGLDVDPQTGDLYVVDSLAWKIYRIRAK
jgi:DNA-binding beta-propeller fold protein YncE